jgi:NDP-sugar pyrophosphorylase family protein
MMVLTAIILAGGLGTRLRSVVADRPKVLAEIHERPFLAYLLDQLTVVGVRNVVICTGYLGEQVRSIFGNSYGKMELDYSQESSPMGTGGALRLALPKLESDPVLVMNGDAFCTINLEGFYAWHRARRARASLALIKVNDAARYGQVQVDPDGVVVHFAEKSDGSGPAWVNAGVYLMDRALLETIETNRMVSLEKESFPAWIGKGLYGYLCEGRFLDIGTPQSYAEAERFFASEVHL